MTLRDARTSEDAATDASSVDAESLEAGADADAFLDASAKYLVLAGLAAVAVKKVRTV